MRACSIAVLVLVMSSTARGTEYTMEDLLVLERQGAWQELYEHLGDPPPSKRDAAWQATAEKASAGYLEGLPLNEKTAASVLDTIDQVGRRFPTLKKSPVFLAKRNDVGLQAFKLTHSRSPHNSGDDPWLDALVKFVEAEPATPDLPARAARLVMTRLVARVALPLWKSAMARQGAVLCKDADFQKSVVESLVDGVWSKEAGEMAQGPCWNEVKAPLLAELEKSEGPVVPRNLCPVLKAKRAAPKKCAPPE